MYLQSIFSQDGNKWKTFVIIGMFIIQFFCSITVGYLISKLECYYY